MSNQIPRFLLVQVITPRDQEIQIAAHLAETQQLVSTFGGIVVDKLVQRRQHPDPNMYIGPGKLEELTRQVKDLDINVVVINAEVRPSQLFRIEKTLWEVDPNIKVWDRVDLILAIFDRHATTKVSKLQIELARITHLGPRIYGLGGTVLSRQGGGIGQRGGFGETNIEFERRLMKTRRQKIEKELKVVIRQKQDRFHHRREQGFGPVALVGYTSAGKTTLFNRLTGKQKLTHGGLFTTLDTVVGRLKLPDQRFPILISDTIGFIDALPPDLIEAFKSTLMESLEAKLLLHLVDVASPNWLTKLQVVDQILTALNSHQPIIYVLNKSDLITPADKEQIVTQIDQLISDRNQLTSDPNHYSYLLISARTGEGVGDLKTSITHHLIPASTH